MSHILILEDDLYLRRELLQLFRKEGFSASALEDFFRAEDAILQESPDLLLLDLNLPYHSGCSLCQSLKARHTFPILVLTGRDTLEDELNSLALGADDFLTKPCPPKRLLARCRKLLRIYHGQNDHLRAEGLSLDRKTGWLFFQDHSILLSHTEAELLALLMEKAPAVLSKKELLCHVWGEGAFVDPNTLQVSIGRLRRRLEELGLADRLITCRGYGYGFRLA